VPAELHADRMQWLIKLCVVRCYVTAMWGPGMHRCLVKCLLRGSLVCTDLSGYVAGCVEKCTVRKLNFKKFKKRYCDVLSGET
jgi:hypothetical protein